MADDAVFVEGARYDAVFDGRAGRWRLLDSDGRDVAVRVSDRCRGGALPPPGLWLLTRDAAGQPELQAFSATPLPAGHPGRVALASCGDTPADALPLPAGVLAWLQDQSGVIHVGR